MTSDEFYDRIKPLEVLEQAKEAYGLRDWKELYGPFPETTEAARWIEGDMDRCEHGRHSIDHCFDCRDNYGMSHGNQFLLCAPETRRTAQGLEVRIGTAVRGEAIWVVAQASAREQGT